MSDEQEEKDLLLLLVVTEVMNSGTTCRCHVCLLNGTRAKQGQFSLLVQQMRQMGRREAPCLFWMTTARVNNLDYQITPFIQNQGLHSVPIFAIRPLQICHEESATPLHSQCLRYVLLGGFGNFTSLCFESHTDGHIFCSPCSLHVQQPVPGNGIVEAKGQRCCPGAFPHKRPRTSDQSHSTL